MHFALRTSKFIIFYIFTFLFVNGFNSEESKVPWSQAVAKIQTEYEFNKIESAHVFHNYPINRNISITPIHMNNITFNITKNSTPFAATTEVSYNNRSHNLVKCNAEEEYNGKFGVAKWPVVGENEFSNVHSPQSNGYITWKCMNDGEFDKEPNWTQCMERLKNVSKPIKNVTAALKVLDIFSKKTGSVNSIISYEILANVVDKLVFMHNFIETQLNIDSNEVIRYTNKSISIVSNLIDQDYAWINSTRKQKTQLASKLLSHIQYCSYPLASQSNPSKYIKYIRQKNINLDTFIANPGDEIVFLDGGNHKYGSVFIPKEDTNRSKIVVGVVIDNLDDYLSGGLDEHNQINSFIVGLSLNKGTESVKLNKEVTVILKHKHKLRFGEKIGCYFWNFNTSLWSSEGCYKVDDESDLFTTVCRCNHLTNFAAIMDMSGRQDNNYLKSIMTYTFSGESILFLSLTLGLSFRLRKERLRYGMHKNVEITIISNLSFCLLIVNILVVSTMDITANKNLCKLSSGLLLYYLLASFFWMLLNGCHMLIKILKPFEESGETNFKLYRLYTVGYSLPLLVCLTGLTTTYFTENVFMDALFDERYNHFCWISSTKYPNHIWLLIGPFLVIVCINFFIFIYLLKAKILSTNHTNYRSGQDLLIKDMKIMSCICLFCNLGFTWLSFILYVREASFPISYLFICFNGQQI